jgi:D-alanine-D-alanine ligase
MKITLFYNAVVDADSAADRDVLVQVAAVEEALQTLGHSTRRLATTLDLESACESLTSNRPDLVFNLVESLAGSDRLAHLAGMLLEDLDLRYTGTSAAALHLTNNKPRAKEILQAAGLPTPGWVVAGACTPAALPPPYIIKAAWEHASLGLDDHAVIQAGDGSTVCDQIASRSRHLGQPCFAEQFIDGREFNLSLIAADEGPRVLPPAEIDFAAFPVGKPRIVGYAAKWDEEAMEFAGTPRKFDFPKADGALLDRLAGLALDCWRLFDLAGYARVDFRVDLRGEPWILEVNANPCLSPDAGFAAALCRAEISFARAIEWIVGDALRVRGQGTGDRSQGTGAHHSPLTTHRASPAVKKKKRGVATKLRTEVRPDDCEIVRRIVAATGLFRAGEIDVAVELVQARLEKGAVSGYEFVFAEQKGQVVGYICFGRNTVTVSSFDVYWIAVEPSKQGQGLGQLLLEEAERRIAAVGGTRVYIETSHRADYQATRGFYDRCGYTLASVLDDFYAPGDSKATYVKVLNANVQPRV